VWKVIGASVTGTAHQGAGTGCQDACGWRSEPGITCLAVADGAGSRPRSGQGAALAVERALLTAAGSARRGRCSDPAGWLRLALQDAQEHITALAATRGNDPGEYAATLAVAVLAGEAAGVAQVGDTIAVLGRSGRYQTAAPAPRGQYVNETTFLTEPGALDQARITLRPAGAVDAVFLSTDGLRFKILADLAAATPFTPFFEDLQAYLHSPGASPDAVRAFLSGLDDQSGDDKTLLAAVRTSPHPAGDGGHPATRAHGQLPAAARATARPAQG
jgi:Protein phosphatase 2C